MGKKYAHATFQYKFDIYIQSISRISELLSQEFERTITFFIRHYDMRLNKTKTMESHEYLLLFMSTELSVTPNKSLKMKVTENSMSRRTEKGKEMKR
jgi:hypothetical protein